MPGTELEQLPEVRNLPEPARFAKILREWLDSEILAAREARGQVVRPEDTHQLVRALQGVVETFGEYGRAFTTAAAVAKQVMGEELGTAVGEQDGIPNQGMTVPDLDGTMIKLALDTVNSYTIDLDVVRVALAELILATTEIGVDLENACLDAALAAPEDRPAAAAERNAVMARALILAMTEHDRFGKPSVGVTAVRKLAKDLGALGDDKLAGAVTGAIRKTTDPRGVKISREQS
jgi:hypothetical protein